MNDEQLAPLQRDLVCDAVSQRYGYSLQAVEHDWLASQLRELTRQQGKTAVTDVIAPLIHDRSLFNRFLHSLWQPTPFFDDTTFYKCVAQHIADRLALFNHPVVWCAGCGTGESVWSLAILLAQHGVLKRTTIFATDMDEQRLAIATRGVYNRQHLGDGAARCFDATGDVDFYNYFDPVAQEFRIKPEFKERVIFSRHDLLQDQAFCEAALIVCRNVLTYLDSEPGKTAIQLFISSLQEAGFLCLGSDDPFCIDGASGLRRFSHCAGFYQRCF